MYTQAVQTNIVQGSTVFYIMNKFRTFSETESMASSYCKRSLWQAQKFKIFYKDIF